MPKSGIPIRIGHHQVHERGRIADAGKRARRNEGNRLDAGQHRTLGEESVTLHKAGNARTDAAIQVVRVDRRGAVAVRGIRRAGLNVRRAGGKRGLQARQIVSLAGPVPRVRRRRSFRN